MAKKKGRPVKLKRDKIVFIRFGVLARHAKIATLEAAALSARYRAH